MNTKNMKLGGTLFLVAGIAFLAVGISGKRPVFFVLGCSFIAIGAGFVGASRKQNSGRS